MAQWSTQIEQVDIQQASKSQDENISLAIMARSVLSLVNQTYSHHLVHKTSLPSQQLDVFQWHIFGLMVLSSMKNQNDQNWSEFEWETRSYLDRTHWDVYLGVEVDRELNWKLQIDRVRQKYIPLLDLTWKVSSPAYSKSCIYQTLVLPQMCCCLVFLWIKFEWLYWEDSELCNAHDTSSTALLKWLYLYSLQEELDWSTPETTKDIIPQCIGAFIHNCAPPYNVRYLVSKFAKTSSLGYTVTCGTDKYTIQYIISSELLRVSGSTSLQQITFACTSTN